MKFEKCIFMDISSYDDIGCYHYYFVLSKENLVMWFEDNDGMGGFTHKRIDMGVIYPDDPIIDFCFNAIANTIDDEEAIVNRGGYEAGFGDTAKIYLGLESKCLDLANNKDKRHLIKWPSIKLDYVKKYLCYILSSLKLERSLKYVDNLLKENALLEEVKKDYENFKNGNSTNKCLDFEYAKLGSYPQMLLEDQTLADKLLEQVGEAGGLNKNWHDSGYRLSDVNKPYFFFSDVTYLNRKFRGIYFEYCSPVENITSDSKRNDVQNENGFECKKYYWFEYLPLIWKAFKEDDHYLLISDFVIDSRDYVNAINAHLDKLLFSAEEKTTIVKSGYESNYKNSNLFILSVEEVKKYLVIKKYKKPIPTQYALIKGYPLDYVKNFNVSPFAWLSNNLGDGTNRNACISEDGTVVDHYCENYGYRTFTLGGVRPAVKVNKIEKIQEPIDYISQVIEKAQKKDEEIYDSYFPF